MQHVRNFHAFHLQHPTPSDPSLCLQRRLLKLEINRLKPNYFARKLTSVPWGQDQAARKVRGLPHAC